MLPNECQPTNELVNMREGAIAARILHAPIEALRVRNPAHVLTRQTGPRFEKGSCPIVDIFLGARFDGGIGEHPGFENLQGISESHPAVRDCTRALGPLPLALFEVRHPQFGNCDMGRFEATPNELALYPEPGKIDL